MIETRPLPVSDNPVDAPFWDGARRGELLVQRCSQCGEYRFPPRPRCPHCHSAHSRWEPVSGRGEIYSYVVPRPPLLPAFERQSPYAVALVSLAELPTIRMIGALIGEPDTEPGALEIERVAIGLPVQAVFARMTDDVHLLRWALLPDRDLA